MSSTGTLIGAGIGTLINPGAGTLAGAQIGGMVGGTAGAATDAARGQPNQSQGIPMGQSNAMQRHLAAMNQGTEKLNAIRDGLMALPEVDDQTRAQAAPKLMQAYLFETAKQSRGVV